MYQLLWCDYKKLYKEKVGWEVNQLLIVGLQKTYEWISTQVELKKKINNLDL